MRAGKPWTEQEKQEIKLAYLEETPRTAASTNPVLTSNTRTRILAAGGGPVFWHPRHDRNVRPAAQSRQMQAQHHV